MLEQKGMIPGTTYIRTWYVYQHFLFDFPFDEKTDVCFFSLSGVLFRPWTHTSDDSYIYQLSLVVATATVSPRAIYPCYWHQLFKRRHQLSGEGDDSHDSDDRTEQRGLSRNLLPRTPTTPIRIVAR